MDYFDSLPVFCQRCSNQMIQTQRNDMESVIQIHYICKVCDYSMVQNYENILLDNILQTFELKIVFDIRDVMEIAERNGYFCDCNQAKQIIKEIKNTLESRHLVKQNLAVNTWQVDRGYGSD